MRNTAIPGTGLFHLRGLWDKRGYSKSA
jgi:hypothetical protein